MFDYGAYMTQWGRVLSGANPWDGDPTNAYGVGHQLLAPLFALHPLAPKLFFILCWFASFFVIVAGRPRAIVETAVFLVLFATPFFVVLIALYGVNDAFVALLVLLAVDLRTRRGWTVAPALLLIAAASTKLYPIALLPFLATDRGKIDGRFLSIAAAALALAAAATIATWGLSGGGIVKLAFARDGKMLSIVWFLYDSPFSPLAHTAFAQALVDWNIVMVGLVMASLYVFHVYGRLRALSDTVLASVCLLTVYKVGNPPYFVTTVLLLIYYLARESSQRPPDRPLLLSAALYLGVLNVFLVYYAAINALYRYPQTTGSIGLPISLAALFLMSRLIAHELGTRGVRAEAPPEHDTEFEVPAISAGP